MRLFIIILLCLTGIGKIFGQATAPSSFETARFRAEIANHYKKLHLPGLSVAVVRDGRIIYRQTEGFD